MRIFAISVCHMQPQIIAYSLTQAAMTMGMHPNTIVWTLVDHHWPLQKQETSRLIGHLSDLVQASVIRPEKNLGGHGGLNFAMEWLDQYHHFSDDDLILAYDPDSNPVTQNWLKAMVEVMQVDTSLDYLSLMPSKCLHNRNWMLKEIAGHRVATDSHPEMINVTLFRRRCAKQKITADSIYYGNIESSMWNRGFKNAYLIDFLEEDCPIPHTQIYVRWKLDHACGKYLGNFDEYITQEKLKWKT